MLTSLKSKRGFARSVRTVFLSAFILNALYENAHAPLYAHYQGGAITEAILLHATFVDAVLITLMALPFLYATRLRRAAWLIVPAGLAVALGIEWWALGTGRWAYGPLMPVLPFLGTGLTPTIQLGFLGYASYWFTQFVSRKRQGASEEAGGLSG